MYIHVDILPSWWLGTQIYNTQNQIQPRHSTSQRIYTKFITYVQTHNVQAEVCILRDPLP